MRSRIMSIAAWLVLAAHAPLLAQSISSFETDQEAKALIPSGKVKAQRVAEHATDGKYALKCFFPGSEKDTWPGLSFMPKAQDFSKYQVFAFDVYNPSKSTTRLSWRIDGVNGKHIFGGKAIKPQRAETVEIFISDLATRLGTTKVKRVYPYIRMPRKDVVLYFDNLRFATVDMRFTAMIYEETAPKPEPTAAERERGYMLASRNWMDVVFANSWPRPGERVKELRAFATPGEYEPVTFFVYALKALEQASVSVSALRGPGGEISASEIAVYPVRGLNKRVTYSSKAYVKNLPVLLERKRQTPIARHESKRFWLDVHVPPSTPAGIYRGTATLRPANAPPAQVPIAIRVLPFKLHEPKGMIWGDYYVKPKLAKTDEEAKRFIDRDLLDQRRHGATSVGMCIGLPAKNAKLTPTGVDLGFDGTSLWEHFMETYVRLGFPCPIVQLSDSGQGFAAAQDAKFGSPEYAAAYKAYWVAVQKLCKAKGWPEVIVQPVDEPGWRDRAAKDRDVWLLKQLKQIPNMRTEQDGPGDDYFHKEAGPYADVWNYNGGIGSPQVVAAAQNAGHVVMLYNCDVESYRPEIGRYVTGFFQKRAGICGYYNWAYGSWCGSPYDDLDNPTGTWMHVYPKYKGEVGGPSTGWQGFREGVDDYKYIATLERAADRALKSGNADAARAAKAGQAALEHILASIDYSPRVRGRAYWTATRTVKQNGITRKIISGTLKAPNGWDFAAYDMARWQLADATLHIMAALGETALPKPAAAASAAPATVLLSNIRWQTVPRHARKAARASHQVAAPVVEAPPKIDGDLSDAAWRLAGKIGHFTLNTGGKPQQQTRAWLCTDEQNLYIAFKCFEDNMGHLTANVGADGGPVWEDDCVEVFIDGNRDQSTCCQICVNSLGKQFWADSHRPGWRAKSVAAARQGKDAWFVELAVPMSDVGIVGTAFGLNLCRERRPMESLELSCWSPTGGAFRQPRKFGLAKIGMDFIRGIDVDEARLGRNTMTLALVNDQARTLRVAAKLRCSQAGFEAATSQAPPCMLKPKATATLSLTFVVQTDAQPVTLRVELLDADSGKPLAKHTIVQQVQPCLKLRTRPAFCYLTDDAVVVEAGVAAAKDFKASAALTVSLRDAQSKKVLRQQVISPIAGDRLSTRLNVAGLGEGEYEVAVSLGSPRLATPVEAAARLTKLRGPFD